MGALRGVRQTPWYLRQASRVAASLETPKRGGDHPKRVGDPPKLVSAMPGPPRLPLLGSSLSLVLHKDFRRSSLQNVWLSWVVQFGPTFRMTLPGFGNVVVVTAPEDIEAMFRATMGDPRRKAFESLSWIRAGDEFYEGKLGLFSSNGEEWRNLRSKIQPTLMKVQNVALYLPKMDQVALQFVERIKELQTLHGEMPDNFDKVIYRWALESVCLIALNRRIGCLEPNLPEDSFPMKLMKAESDLIAAFNEVEFGVHFWRLFRTPAFRRLEKANRDFVQLADSCIRETEEALKSERRASNLSMLEQLLGAPGLSRKDAVLMIMDLIVGGVDTTSNAVGFILYLLAKNPEAQVKLQEELDQVLGDGRKTLALDNLNQLSYLKAVVKESFRLFPVAPGTARILAEDTELGGYLVPKGFTVLALGMAASMNEANFPRASQFIPDRWLRSRPMGPISPFASFPFSYGPRMCVGRRIAEQEIYTLLARVMHRFNIDYKYGEIKAIMKASLAPGGPLKFSFSERR